jgi:hypothetical protein
VTGYAPALVAQAIHDVTCPEGPDCRDRLLHSAAQPLANTGVLAQFLDRLHELDCQRPFLAMGRDGFYTVDPRRVAAQDGETR